MCFVISHSRSSIKEVPSARRLQAATLGISAVLLLIVAGLMALFGLEAVFDGSFTPMLLLLTLLGGAKLVQRKRPNSRVALAAFGIGLLTLASAAGAALGMLVLRFGCPQADERLREADHLLGIDAVSVVEWVSTKPLAVVVLRYAYSSSIPLLLLSIIAIGLSGKASALWRACCMYVGTLLTTCLISGMVPAKGSFLGVRASTRALLPEGAGTYAFEAYDLFHAGAPHSLSFSMLSGLACFPSFHTAAALLLQQTWWGQRKLRPVLIVWCSIVLLSTIPMGGHYVVDILGGALLFVASAAVTEWISAPKSAIQSRERGGASITIQGARF